MKAAQNRKNKPVKSSEFIDVEAEEETSASLSKARQLTTKQAFKGQMVYNPRAAAAEEDDLMDEDEHEDVGESTGPPLG